MSKHEEYVIEHLQNADECNMGGTGTTNMVFELAVAAIWALINIADAIREGQGGDK
jgi:hypothetical protein